MMSSFASGVTLGDPAVRVESKGSGVAEGVDLQEFVILDCA